MRILKGVADCRAIRRVIRVILILIGLAIVEVAVFTLALDMAPIWAALAVLATLSGGVSIVVLWVAWSKSD
jgi:hypothetical protein